VALIELTEQQRQRPEAADLRPCPTAGFRLKKLASLASDQFKMGILLYDGEETLPLGDDIWAAPLAALWGK
jgi:hypothetical protein